MELIILFGVLYYFTLSYCDQPKQITFISGETNYDLTYSNGRCDIPKPLIVYPDDEFPNKYTGRQFIPRGTVLYRCNNSTGCCSNFNLICVAVELKKIDIEFFVSSKSNSKRKSWVRTSDTFSNHTRCECRDVRIKSEKLSSSAQTAANEFSLTVNIKIALIVVSLVSTMVMVSLVVLVTLYFKRYQQYKQVIKNQTNAAPVSV